jgi:hypothetical protein
MITNAKVKNLEAGKIWIGDYASTSDGWRPYTGHCVWDLGQSCKYHGWTEDQVPPTGYYKTGSCPIGVAATPCNYTESIFALTRIFGMTNSDDPLTPEEEWTYIEGGLIMTDTIRTRSIQVGAMPYVLDLQANRIYDDAETNIDSYVYIQWSKAGENPELATLVNGYVSFANGEGHYILAGRKKFTQTAGEIPTGTGTSLRKIHVAYISMLTIGSSPSSVETVQWRSLTLEVSGAWNPDNSFSQLRTEGSLPLFAVIITKHQSVLGEQNLWGKVGSTTVSVETLVSSDAGQFNVQIVMATSSPGTYIINNDITTGIIHNEYWTSWLDLRLYTGYDIATTYKGHGRLILDGPSSFYAQTTMIPVGDNFGKGWWNFVATYAHAGYDTSKGTDTKFLIGRPYVDGIEVPYSVTKSVAEGYGDNGYLWFYKQYNTSLSKWVGFLELGGKFRCKDITNYRDVLIGQEYYDTGSGWKRRDAPGVFVYKTTNLYTLTYPNNYPILLAKIGGTTQLNVLSVYSASHYLNNDPSVDEYTLCLDYNRQIPLGTFTDWGYATLLVIPATYQSGNRACGISVRSPAGTTSITPPSYGINVSGNFSEVAIYGKIIKTVDSETTIGVAGYCENTSNSMPYAIGVQGNSLAGNYGTSMGIVGIASGGAYSEIQGIYGYAVSSTSTAYISGGVFSAAGITGGVASAIDLRPSAVGGAFPIHIRFGRGYLAGDTAPDESKGIAGDLIACSNRLYYRTVTGPTYWKRITMT